MYAQQICALALTHTISKILALALMSASAERQLRSLPSMMILNIVFKIIKVFTSFSFIIDLFTILYYIISFNKQNKIEAHIMYFNSLWMVRGSCVCNQIIEIKMSCIDLYFQVRITFHMYVFNHEAIATFSIFNLYFE